MVATKLCLKVLNAQEASKCETIQRRPLQGPIWK
jgi:hypothetical protein